MKRDLGWVLLMLAAACGDPDPGEDAGEDAASDSATDAAMDSSVSDSGVDSGGDSGGRDTSRPDASGGCSGAAIPTLRGVDIAPGHRWNSTVFVTSAPGDPDTLYAVERGGTIQVVRDGVVSQFLQVEGLVSGGEQGLLGLAFHPDYEANGRFFVYYTPSGPERNAVAEYRRSDADPFVADPVERTPRLIDVRDTEGNHNGGMLAFGPDGFLYVGIGDEGGGGDLHGPIGHGLNKGTLFGSILRLDVDNPPTFAAAGNPFSADEGLPQIWAYGLRNPWRFSFDRATGDLFIGDVGQDDWEEVSVIEAGTPPGRNLGWRIYEGNSVFDPTLLETRGDELVPEHHGPVLDVTHELGSCSITGGYVYRGDAIPELRGYYLFSDFCLSDVVAFQYCDGEATNMTTIPSLRGLIGPVASFGEDGHGELYLVYLDGILKIVPE